MNIVLMLFGINYKNYVEFMLGGIRMKINCMNYPKLIRYFVPVIEYIQLKDVKKTSGYPLYPMRIKDTKQEGFSISLHDIREQFNPYELDIVDYCDDLYSERLSIWKNININNNKLKDCDRNNNEYLIQFRTYDD